MSWWTAIMVIAIVAIMAEVWKTKHRAQHGTTSDMMGNEKPLAPSASLALQREVQELRERITVLERILTDERQSRAISAEIEELRDR